MTDDERDELLIRMDAKMETVAGRLDDHGRRLKALEQFRYWTGGIGTVAAALWAKAQFKIGLTQ